MCFVLCERLFCVCVCVFSHSACQEIEGHVCMLGGAGVRRKGNPSSKSGALYLSNFPFGHLAGRYGLDLKLQISFFCPAFFVSITMRGFLPQHTKIMIRYDLSTLVTSTWVVYGFAVVSPVALWLILNQLNIPVTLIKVKSLAAVAPLRLHRTLGGPSQTAPTR